MKSRQTRPWGNKPGSTQVLEHRDRNRDGRNCSNSGNKYIFFLSGVSFPAIAEKPDVGGLFSLSLDFLCILSCIKTRKNVAEGKEILIQTVFDLDTVHCGDSLPISPGLLLIEAYNEKTRAVHRTKVIYE